jgi:ATP-binding cassette subfamily F protein 3
MAKRNEKNNTKVEYEASRLLDEQKGFAGRLYNPILDYTTTKGKNKDIKIENLDISFAGRRNFDRCQLDHCFW